MAFLTVDGLGIGICGFWCLVFFPGRGGGGGGALQENEDIVVGREVDSDFGKCPSMDRS